MANTEQTRQMANFLKRKFSEFISKEVSRGHGVPSQNEFAKWLGVKPTSLSSWVTELRPPSGENIDLLATKLGLEVYEILGIPARVPKDKRFQVLVSRWHMLTDQQKDELAERTQNFAPDGGKS